MQVSLSLFPEAPIHLDFSYYPKLAAALYQVISYADEDFANELHDGDSYRNRIKLFGFSPLHSRQTEIYPENRNQKRTGGLVFKGKCSFTICSPWPELMDRFVKGFSGKSQLRIGSQLLFMQKPIILPVPNFKKTMIWHPISPGSCVTSWSNRDENKKYYALPENLVEDLSCESLLRGNLIHKWRRLKEIRPDIAEAWLESGKDMKKEDFAEEDIQIRLLPLSGKKSFHRKRHQIRKAPVFSWIAPVEITAPVAIQRIAWSCGLGEMNSMGFGVVGEVPR